MKFSEKWLREYVDPDLTTQELVDQLTMGKSRLAIYAREAQQLACNAGCALNHGPDNAPWMAACGSQRG